MEKREKAKTSNIRRVRPRVSLTIDPGNHEYLKNASVNVSRLLDRTIFELRKITPHNLVLISEKKEESWARPELNRQTPPCQGDVITGAVAGLAGEKHPGEISRTLREDVSLNTFYQQHKKDFIEFMKNQKLMEKTITDYTRALESLELIYNPPDIGTYEDRYGVPLSSKVEKAIGKLIQFSKIRHASTTLLGYDHGLWRVQFAALKAAAEEADDSSRVKDLTTQEIEAGYQRVDDHLKIFYAFVVYTGMRAEQAYDVLKKWDDKRVEEISANVDGENIRFCRYATSDVSRGKKMSYYAYFPASIREQIQIYKLPTTPGTMTKNIREQATTDPARPINVSNLRKYAVNMLRKGKAADWDVAEYIQGRRPKGVGQARYLSLGDLANEQYPIALHRNMPDLIPPKSQTKTQRGPAKGSKQKGGVERKPVDYAKVKRMLKAGKTHREIIAETGINKIRLSEYLKEHPEFKRK